MNRHDDAEGRSRPIAASETIETVTVGSGQAVWRSAATWPGAIDRS